MAQHFLIGITMTDNQVLSSTDTVGEPFERSSTFMVVLGTHTDGWRLQHGIPDENGDVADANWKNWDDFAIAPSGSCSHTIAYGTRGIKWRLHGGTAGATAYALTVDVTISR